MSRCKASETDEVEFKWEIKEFSKVKNEIESESAKCNNIKSNEFSTYVSFPKQTWHLELSYELEDSYNIVLRIHFGKPKYTVKYCIFNNEQKIPLLDDSPVIGLLTEYGSSHYHSIASQYLNDERYLFNDTLTIICSLVEYGESIQRMLPLSKDCPKNLLKDIHNLLTSEQHSDVTLIVNGIEFKVHKMILIARSPVFAAMFKHKDFQESQTNQVVIKDTNPHAMKIFLEFIYSDKIEKLGGQKFYLYALADKYQIETLKIYCEQFIYDNLNEECALNVLQFADTYNIEQLLNKALNYFIVRCRQIIKTGEWKSFAETNPNLYDLILDRVIQNF